jgi:phosphoglucosamine mutase
VVAGGAAMNPQLPVRFGVAGIRGVVGEPPLDAPTLLRIGRAVGRWLRSQAAIPTAEAADAGAEQNTAALIGHDTRANCMVILQALATGLMAEGITVFNAGVITAAGIAHAMQGQSFGVGVVISGDSLPHDHNGLIVIGRGGILLTTSDERLIEAQIDALAGDRATRRSGGFKRYSLLPASDVHEKYLQHLIGWAEPNALAGLSVVLDCGHGAGHKIAPDAFERVGATVTVINDAPDGLNVNVGGGADYVRLQPVALAALVQHHRADVGIALDAMGTRVTFLTPRGRVLSAVQVLGILAVEMQKADNLPAAGVAVASIDPSDGSSALATFLNKRNIRVMETDPGLRPLVEFMRERGLRLGGTMDGGVIILDEAHTYADAVYAALLLCWLIAHHKRSGGPSLDALAAAIDAL